MPLAEVTIRHLELTSPREFRPRRTTTEGVRFTRVPRPMPELNRFFYMAVGAEWFWLERRGWTHAEWMAFLDRPAVETWVLSVDGLPAGYTELERHANADCEIKYFGLLPAWVGRGLGAHLLTEAVERAWATGASRVILDTCNLDHPRALANYRARGFREYRIDVKQKELPEHAPGPWNGAWPGSNPVGGTDR